MNVLRNWMSSLWFVCSRSGTARKRLRNFARAESGAAAMFFALSAPVWLGGLALGAEVGAWHYYQQKLQTTADALAVSIAARVGTGPSQVEINGLAVEFLTRNQFNFSRGTWEAVLSEPPRESVFVDGSSVNVKLTRTVKRLLSGVFTPGDFTIEANAAARVNQATEGCILSLRPPAAGVGLEFTLSANIQVFGCEVLSNDDDFIVWGGSRLDTDCARGAGFILRQGPLNVTCQNGPVMEAGLTLDPYINLEDINVEAVAPHCSVGPDGRIDISSTQDLDEKLTWDVNGGRAYARVCHGTEFYVSGPGRTINIQNRTLIFEGTDFNLEDGTDLDGNNVSFYFVDDARPVIQAPNSKVTLTADASGMLFRGARENAGGGNPNQIAVGPESSLKGAIYFPASHIQFQASGNLNGCPQIIGNTLSLRGTWRLEGPCNVPGILPIVASRVTRLTQ